MPNKEGVNKAKKFIEETEKLLSREEGSVEKEGIEIEKKEKAELNISQKEKRIEEKEPLKKGSHEISIPSSGGFIVQQKQQQKQVEKILEEDLEEVYSNLPKEKQIEFKRAGEETAVKIVQLLNQTKIKIKKMISLIIRWLSIIPGVNRFFLEQEAKIKADEIMKIKK